MRRMVMMAVLSSVAGSALASGGFSCEAKDSAASFLLESGVTHGMGGPSFNFRGTIDITAKDVPDDLRKMSFAQENLAQYWLDGKELRLVVYREREADKPHGYVELTILTKTTEEGSTEGTYALSVYDVGPEGSAEGKTVEAKGKVGCFVE